MLQIQKLSKTYGVEVVLADLSFVLNDGEHVGLIGPNGAGKSTILRCLVGEERPDSGTIVFSPADLSLGYLPQALGHLADRTVGEAIATARADLVEAEDVLRRASDELAAATDSGVALAAYDDALTRFEALGGYEREQRASDVVQRLGLGALDPDQPVSTLSGGQKTRLGLALLLLRSPDLLLLDEPTNHLDVPALEWLESFVQEYPGAALIVSHDRVFLDRTVSRVLYLDPRTRSVTSYVGGYQDFATAREHERQLEHEAWKRQEEYVEKVERDVSRLKSGALAIERSTTPSQPHVRRLARKKARLAKSRERKLERFLESDEHVEKPESGWGLKLDFGPSPAGARTVLRLEKLSFGYPGQPLLLNGVDLAVQHGQKIALVGPNGAGKTTLLKLIAGDLAPRSGRVTLGASVRLGILAQEQETLDPDRGVLDTALAERPMSETEARSFLHFFLFAGDAVFRKVGACSLGERGRLQLALLVLRGCDLLLLDEPLNHLDVAGREHFEAALDAFQGTVIAVSHDRAFLNRFAQQIVEIGNGQARIVEGETSGRPGGSSR